MAFKNVYDVVKLGKNEWLSRQGGNNEQRQRRIKGQQAFGAGAYSGK